ncbi:MAG: DNA polymerase III subunit gamma/tau [Chloroflexota bacterium]|nr:DNA polymerase III subunit gamma/tau [Chloroflexota bacterium]
MTKALYRKWRPQDWDQVAGQEHVVQTLRNAVRLDRVAHAYLFAGPRGTGKTTSARLLAKSVNCLEPDLEKRPCNECEYCQAVTDGRFMDLIEIDAASNTSVDDIRDLREKINFAPSQGRYKVYIIDEVHMLSTAAFNALLKTLEEPPPHAIFVLATTEIHKIPATVLSRCQRHEFRRIPIEIIVNHLKVKSKEEGIQVEEAVFTEIARQATGSLRDAISLLDQLTSTEEKITLSVAQNVLGTATSLRVIEIVDALVAKDPAQGLSQINQALDGGTDPRQLARQIVTYLRSILLHKMGNLNQEEIPDDIRPKVHEHANNLNMAELLRAVEAFNQAASDKQASWHPGLGLELAFTEFLVEPVVRTASVVEEADRLETAVRTASTVSQPKPKPTPKPSAASAVKTDQKAAKTQQPAKAELQEEVQSEEKQAAPVESNKSTPKAALSEPQPEPSAFEGELSFDAIHKSWRKIKAMVGKHNPRTEGLLNTSKLTGLKGNTLILGFSSETLQQMMEKEGNINLTADILEEVFGRPIAVKCIVSSHQSGSLPDNVVIDKDGMVSTATRDLGGEITDAKEAE